MKGMVGLALKPVVGVLDMLSQSTNGVKNSTQKIFKLRDNVDSKVYMVTYWLVDDDVLSSSPTSTNQ